MPGFLLHQAANVQCPHAGRAQPTAPSPRVLLSGQPAVTIASPYVIAGCADPPPPGGNGPCVTASFVTAARRVLVMGRPVLLDDGQSVCQPTGVPLRVLATQTRVIGI